MSQPSTIVSPRNARILAGMLAWAGILVGVWWVVDQRMAGGKLNQRVVPRLWDYWTEPRQTLTLELPPRTEAAVGDPLFVQEANGAIRQVGEVRSLSKDGKTLPRTWGTAPQAQVLLFTTSLPHGPDSYVTYHVASQSLPDVFETLVTPQRRDEILEDLEQTWRDHHREILAAFSPVIENTLRDVVRVAEKDLPPALARHTEELNALGRKYQTEIVEKELLPLAQEEILPILQKRAEPALNEVGHEIWRRVSLWRFGWRIAVDKTVLPKAELTRKEWERFLQREVEPILVAHADDFVRIVQETVQDAAENERVRDTVDRVVRQIVGDPEFTRILRTIADEVVIDNPRMHQAIINNWTSPAAQDAAKLVGERFEPVLRRSADRIFGTKHGGVTPEFAQVLRNQILGKDRRWFLLQPGDLANSKPRRNLVMRVQTASGSPAHPFIQLRAQRGHDDQH
ncbi:MAG: hypothetical protein AB7O62_15700 [Pirellulales bacterium]